MRRLIAAFMATSFALAAAPDAARADNAQGGAVIGVAVSLAGFSTPSIHWENPCGTEPYTAHSAGPTTLPMYRDRELDITIATFSDELTIEAWRDWARATYGPDTGSRIVRGDVRYVRYCYDPATEDIDASTTTYYWVPIVSEETVVPALFERLWEYISGPVVSWPSMDQEFGWLYVQAPMDFRIEQLSPVSLTASVTNITGSVTATVSATPESLLLEPGEPGGVPVVCPIAASTAAYAIASPGACSYTYANSSAIAAAGEFDVYASVVWRVVTSDPTFGVDSVRTWSWSSVAVAEAQAVVTR